MSSASCGLCERNNLPPWAHCGGFRALLALGGVLVAGTVRYVLLGFSFLDALYQTVTTVGFREVHR